MPKHCWWCNRQLVPKKGGGYHHVWVYDPLGNNHAIHKQCLPDALKDGNKKTEIV